MQVQLVEIKIEIAKIWTLRIYCDDLTEGILSNQYLPQFCELKAIFPWNVIFQCSIIRLLSAFLVQSSPQN